MGRGLVRRTFQGSAIAGSLRAVGGQTPGVQGGRLVPRGQVRPEHLPVHDGAGHGHQLRRLQGGLGQGCQRQLTDY